MDTVVKLASALIEGIPNIIKAIKAGRNPNDIKLSEVISTDAIATVQEAIDTAKSFEDQFE